MSADAVEFGKAVADVLRPHWPHLASALETGVMTDCSSLLASIQANAQDANALQLGAMFNVLENAYVYWEGESTKAHAEAGHLRKQVDQLVSQNGQLTSALEAMKSVGANRGRRETADPDKFTADDTDIAKRQEKFLNFRAAVNRVIAIDSHIFNSDYKVIQYIAGRLDGTCASQYRPKFETITDNQPNPELWAWRTPAQVWAALNAHYIVLDLAKEAEQDLKRLKMANKPYPSFIAEFSVKAAQAELTDEEKVSRLRVKVSDELNTAVQVVADVPSKSDINGWVALYQKLWDRNRDDAWVNKDRNQASDAEKNRQNQANKKPQQPALGDDPMDLDLSALSTKGTITRVQCIARGLCFYCKESGHAINECLEKKVADAKALAAGRGALRGGRGDFRGGFRSNAPNRQPFYQQRQSWAPFQPQFNRLRSIDRGFVEGEVSSVARISDRSDPPSLPDLSTPMPSQQGSQHSSGKD